MGHLFFLDRGPGVAAADAHIVVQDVEAAVALHTGADHRLAVGLAGGVRLEGHGLAALLLDHRHRVPGRRQVAIDRHHPGPFAREQHRRRTAVPDRVAGRLPGADHYRHLALEPAAHVLGSLGRSPDSSCMPRLLSAMDTRLYCPTVNTRLIICLVL